MSFGIDDILPSARQIAADVAQGNTTCEAVVRDCLERIESLDKDIGAWVFIDHARAIEEARVRDCEGLDGRAGELRGVPIGVKDVFDTADMPTCYGSAAYSNFRPAADAYSVAALRHAGGIAIGKTVSTEFACVAPNVTRNPHNNAHTPGGSSSGSAAAVAAGMVPLALGTQTSGSTIRPASFCGVVGYKPTFGLIDRTGIKALSGSLDTVSIFARNVADAGFFAACLSGDYKLGPEAPIEKPRISLYRTPHWARADSDSQLAVERTAEMLRQQGLIVTEVTAPFGFENLLELHQTIMGYEACRTLAFEDWNKRDLLAEKTCDFLNDARSISFDAYFDALRILRILRAKVDDLYQDCDVLLTPAATGAAPAGLTSTGDPTFNRIWTALHVPCITIPAGRTARNLPIGVQFVGKPLGDHLMLSAATLAEAAIARQ